MAVGITNRSQTMTIPTEPIGSIPRPLQLIEAVTASGGGSDLKLNSLYEEAIKDTIERFEATGSPVITDGEQRKYHNFWTYSVHGLPNTAPDGFRIPFAAGHVRRMLRLTGGPFHYNVYADQYLAIGCLSRRRVSWCVLLKKWSPLERMVNVSENQSPIDYVRPRQLRSDLHNEHAMRSRDVAGVGIR
jgi:hypothetical protein